MSSRAEGAVEKTILKNCPEVHPRLECFDLSRIPYGDATYLHYDPDALLERFPYLREGIDRLFQLLPRRTFATVDYQYRRFKRGESTAPHTRWHCDGESNEHLIYCLGSFGTAFLLEPLEIERTDDPTRRDALIHLACSGRRLAQLEAPHGCPVTYSASEVHAARTITADGDRFFIRLCVSDYLAPRNKIFKFSDSYGDPGEERSR